MNNKYKMALSEVNQILLHTEEEIILKIPQTFINFVKKNMDENHRIKIEEGKKLIEQNIMQETKQILALIYRDYLCSKEERENIIRQEQEEWDKEEKEKQEKYEINFDKIKENRKQQNLVQKLETESEWELVTIQEKKWYKKFINKILEVFQIKKS